MSTSLSIPENRIPVPQRQAQKASADEVPVPDRSSRPPLKILLVSYTLPQLGGLETMTNLIARELSLLGGIEVRILTPNAGEWNPGYAETTIHRQPSLSDMHADYRWADVVFFNHFYLRLALPLLWMPTKPVVLSISGYDAKAPVYGIKQRLASLLIRGLLHRANSVIACNDWCRDHLPVAATVVPNPYDEQRFQKRSADERRDRDFLFAGRLVEDKGCMELVEAFAAVMADRATAGSITLSIAGEGPQREAIEKRLEELGVHSQVRFLGKLNADTLAGEMRRHRILVVPSRYREPLGITALEGLASGCLVIGSRGGGLGATIGQHGFTFTNGHASELASVMKEALALDSHGRQALLNGVEKHLESFRSRTVVEGYLRVVFDTLERHRRA